ncbi:NADP-dependent isocitrate dehydrogenase, partial [Pseudomonas sp. SIMBA_068]
MTFERKRLPGAPRVSAHALAKKRVNPNMPTRSKIIYTFTDEAPALATYSLLPIVE